MVRLGNEEEELRRKCERRDDRIMELGREIEKIHGFYEKAVEEQARQTRTMEERLKRTEELLAARSAELSGAHAFLSTTDCLSEVEVLSIVRDLNENIYQVAVKLTDEWEKLVSTHAATRMDTTSLLDPTSTSSFSLSATRTLQV